jgi:bacteriocin-like protein
MIKGNHIKFLEIRRKKEIMRYIVSLGSLLLVTILLFSTIVYASDDIGQYRILLSTCKTAEQAASIQQNLSANTSSLAYFTSLRYNVSANIITNNGEYKVYVGNYPTFGEARYISREFVKQGYQITIEQIKEPVPDPAIIIGTADDIYSKASTSEAEKDYSRAIAYYTALTNQYPTDERKDRALIQIGICKSKSNDKDGALSLFQAIANSNSSLAAETQWRIGYLYLSLYNLDNAKQAFSLVTSRFPDSSVVADTKERLKAFTSTSADDAVYKQAMFAIAAQKYSLAVDYLNQYTKNYPTAPRIDEAYLRLANCKINLGDRIGAFEGYKQLIQYPKSQFVRDACGELTKLAGNLGGTYLDSAIDALSQSPCLNPSNQKLSGLFQTDIAWLLQEKIPKTLGGKLTTTNSTLADQSTCWAAIAECRKVKTLYPNASRYDLARAALIEVECFCRFDNETTVINLGKQLIATYPDQRKQACYAQHLIARAYENIKDYDHALEGYQTLIDTYTEADNITTADDLIAFALFRKAKCLQILSRPDEAKAVLQEIVQNHARSGMIIWAKQELKLLDDGVNELTKEEMQQIIGGGEPCQCMGEESCGIDNCHNCEPKVCAHEGRGCGQGLACRCGSYCSTSGQPCTKCGCGCKRKDCPGEIPCQEKGECGYDTDCKGGRVGIACTAEHVCIPHCSNSSECTVNVIVQCAGASCSGTACHKGIRCKWCLGGCASPNGYGCPSPTQCPQIF